MIQTFLIKIFHSTANIWDDMLISKLLHNRLIGGGPTKWFKFS